MSKATRALDIVLIITAIVMLLGAAHGCVRSQERNNPCDPAVATPTPEVAP